jgi:hypothetical protein
VHASTTDGILAGWAVLKDWANYPQINKRIIILDRKRHDLHEDGCNISIIGCTLLSNHRRDQQPQVAGFDKGIVGTSSSKHNARHNKDLLWLKYTIAQIRAENEPGRVIIVMTHHAPCITGTSAPECDGVGDSWSNFQVDILGGLGIEGLGKGDVWVFGHTHFSAGFEQDEVRVLSNQRGAGNVRMEEVREMQKNNFDPTRVLEVECVQPFEWQNRPVPH